MRRFWLCLLLLLPCGGQLLAAQNSSVGMQVTLGNAAVELSGPWRFHTGDNMAWAQPGFDDSGWTEMDLTPPPGTADATLGSSGYIPGWTDRGFAGYSGYAWYRLTIDVQGADDPLALKMPDNADDAYQVYVNGQPIGTFGKFTSHGVTAYSTLPRAFRLPPDLRSGRITLAIRMWMDSATPFNSPDAGGLHEPPVLGHASAIAAQIRLGWDDVAHGVGSGFLEMLILLLALAVALSLFSLDRTEAAYRWLALVSLITLIGNSIVLLVNFTALIGQSPSVILIDDILTPVRIGLWVVFWGYWFRLERMGRLHREVWGFVLLLAMGTALLRPPLYGQLIPVHAATYLVPFLLVVKLALAVLLFWVTYQGIRRHGAEGWLALPAVLLAAISQYQHELRLIHVPTEFSLFGFQISLGTVSTMLSLLLVTVMLSRRFLHSQRRQEQWRLEIKQAQHVQQVLIPEKSPTIAGLSIESEYRPAREVGGDFFQIIPGEHDGSVLIVVGDVTGKGLQAGMLVALIVGAIRSTVQHDSDPLSVLNSLNAELCDREHASATCLMLRIAADGMVTLANAGHLPPYLNGREMQMEGSLPLGIVAGTEFPVMYFKLKMDDTLMLMSDGIAEAQNQHGLLFGFERIDRMLSHPITAAELATAAQEFGQEDDILVLRIERSSEPKTVTHVEPVMAVT
ncbi:MULTISPECIES: PP2C family protein-serine/threonine phosphatase [Acidobacteriaceae]|uniref:PP2C family protein-serine/threonine phosphatase n=1 Tax=Acidobacteriaceae TaxID=204434 RepID=UPI00131CB51E|nr:MULTISPECIES: SpoIIE family protein phosphatase [Acidobacteriaceae]MDW5267465.1 SpoIIE family protein phosphatase [Edaphobacter sp.]